jgi:DNA ligase 1
MDYEKLAELYHKIESTSKRLEKTEIIATFLKNCQKEDLKKVIYLLQGRVFAQGDERKLGMSSKLLLKSIVQSTGNTTQEVERVWRDEGDLGLALEKLAKKKKQNTLFSKKLTLKKVVANIQKISSLEGAGTVNKKVGLVSELLSGASPLESKYIIRTVTEVLRTGVGNSLIRDSLIQAFYPEYKELKEDREAYKKVVEQIQHAVDVTSDFGELAQILKEKGFKGLEEISLVVGKPIKVMLWPKAQNIEEGFELLGKPTVIQPKLDGFRVQIHRKKDEINLFTRKLENVTKQFPDVVKIVKECVMSKEVILDSEVVGINLENGRMLPFQDISQRIKRKHGIEAIIKKLPVEIYVFDVIELNGEDVINTPLEERRKKLKAIIKPKTNKLQLIDQLVTSDLKKAEKYYQDCLDKGLEGVMMKKVGSIYKPGRRVGDGVKVKPVMEALDLVIVAAEWGEGKRAKWLSSFTVACQNGNEFKTIGKVGTGIKEKTEEGVTFKELTDELKKIIIEEKGKTVKVKPKIILELMYEEIQKSPSYSSGYALRFPRVHRLRPDKALSEIATNHEIEKLFLEQKGKLTDKFK